MIFLAVAALVYFVLVCFAMYHNGYVRGQLDVLETLLRSRK